MSHALPRFAGAAAATLGALCAAGAWPTSRMADGDGLVAMGVAAGISLVGAIGGFLPVALTPDERGLEARAQMALVGIGVRLLLTAALVFAAMHVDGVPSGTPFVAWVGVDYVALLVLETAFVVRAVRRLDGKGPVSA